MIEVKNLYKKYGDKVVTKDVSITLPKGQIISFIGANGAGKSTVLSMVSRLLKKDRGEIYIDKNEISTFENIKLAKKISTLKQTNHMNIRLTVEELVSFGRFPYSQGRLNDEDKRIVNEAIEYMGLYEIRNRYLDELSGGQKQMAYIAMVIAQDTEYILLDEPLNNLDMKHSVEIMKILKRLVKELSKTVIIVIHDINFASVYSDYIVALKNGEIVKEGATDTIINQETLKEIYNMDIEVRDIHGKRLCIYFS